MTGVVVGKSKGQEIGRTAAYLGNSTAPFSGAVAGVFLHLFKLLSPLQQGTMFSFTVL